jgi:hypothetical protein
LKHALAIRHVAFEDLGTIGGVLEARDYQTTYVPRLRRELQDQLPAIARKSGATIEAWLEAVLVGS